MNHYYRCVYVPPTEARTELMDKRRTALMVHDRYQPYRVKFMRAYDKLTSIGRGPSHKKPNYTATRLGHNAETRAEVLAHHFDLRRVWAWRI